MLKIELKYKIKQEENNFKVSKILLNKLDISNRLLTKLKMNEKILVNDKPVFSNYIVHEGDLVIVKIDFIEQDYIQPEKMDLEILYEDEYLLAVNKPAGVVVHPSANHLSNTLANGVKYYLNNNKKIRAINRLDRDTSGIVLFAKNEYIQELMIKKVTIDKEYIAIASGTIDKKEGTINKPIRRKYGSIMEREVSEKGQEAITHYTVLNELLIKNDSMLEPIKISVLKLKLETGRTHQIRVHLKSIGVPILGDSLYDKESKLISRQALHAFHIHFKHPITGIMIDINAPIPKDMADIIKV